MRRAAPRLGTSWGQALKYVPEKYRVDHSPDQYGMETSFSPPEYSAFTDRVTDGDENKPIYNLTKGLTPPTESQLYSPMKEPFIVPAKYRRQYNFVTGHGKYLYTKDPLWIEARERHWDDQSMALYVYRRNYEHVRRKYRKQWQDAHRYNCDEYLTVLNRVRRQESAEREVTEQRRTDEWTEDLSRIDAIAALQEKRRALQIERKWQVNVWLWERYSEELQYLKQHKEEQDFITMENMDHRIEEELNRWVQSSNEGGVTRKSDQKLNMFGRLPYGENEDCQPLLELQFQFMNAGTDSGEDLADDPRQAFQRLCTLEDDMLRADRTHLGPQVRGGMDLRSGRTGDSIDKMMEDDDDPNFKDALK